MSMTLSPSVQDPAANGRSTAVARGPSARLGQAIVLIIVLLFALSGGVLWYLGLNYDGLTGNPVSKIHPATYLTILVFFATALTWGNPANYIVHVAQRRPGAMLLMLVSFALFTQIVLRGGSGLAGSVDTYVATAFLFLLMTDLDEDGLRRTETALHCILLANALLGLGEFLSGHLVFPYRFEGDTFETDTRSTALQGHPLSNAGVTTVYVLALMTGGSSLTLAPRLAMIGLQAAALVTFGSRTAIIIVLMFGLICGVIAAHRVLSRGRIHLLGAAAAIGFAVLLPLGALSLSTGGFFDKLLARFASDGGSANARVQMFDLFSRLPLRDLIFGADTGLVDSLRRVEGLEWGIENPFIRMTLYQGLFMTALVSVAVVVFIAEVLRLCRKGTLIPLIGFVILINSSESIAGKTSLLAKFGVIMVALYRPPTGRAGGREAR